MAVEFGKNFINAFLGTSSVNAAKATTISGVKAPQAYKTAGYAAIPYERAPQVTDWYNANELLGADCPKQVWVA